MKSAGTVGRADRCGYVSVFPDSRGTRPITILPAFIIRLRDQGMQRCRHGETVTSRELRHERTARRCGANDSGARVIFFTVKSYPA